MEDDLGVGLKDEYDPAIPNDFEELYRVKRRKEREQRRQKEAEAALAQVAEKRTLTAYGHSDSESDDEEETIKEEKRRG